MLQHIDRTKVYRVEHMQQGFGPYSGPVGQNWQTKPHNALSGCPGPYDDCELWKHLRDFQSFGFPSLEALRSWFDVQELWNLAAYGFVISVYDAKNVVTTPKQCVFNKDQSLLIDHIPLT